MKFETGFVGRGDFHSRYTNGGVADVGGDGTQEAWVTPILIIWNLDPLSLNFNNPFLFFFIRVDN